MSRKLAVPNRLATFSQYVAYLTAVLTGMEAETAAWV